MIANSKQGIYVLLSWYITQFDLSTWMLNDLQRKFDKNLSW